MHTRYRLIAAAAAVALITGVAGGAAAATTGTASPSASASSSAPASASSASAPAPKPSPTGTGDNGKPGDKQAWLVKLAASLHVSVQKLESALIDAKQTVGRLGVGPFDPAVVAVVSHDLGISTDRAAALLKEVFGNPASGGPGKGGNGSKGGNSSGPDQLIINTLAGILHVSDARAKQVLERLEQISEPGHGVSPQDPRFRAIAASLHLTPQQLADALMKMKQTLAASMPR